MRAYISTAIFFSTLAFPAAAQVFSGRVMRAGCNYGSEANCITLNFQLQIPSPTLANSADFSTAVTKANSALFDILNHECSILQSALHGDCRLTQLNVSTNVNDRPGSDEPSMTASASATYSINTKQPDATEPHTP